MHAHRSSAGTMTIVLVAVATAVTGCASTGYPGLADPTARRQHHALRVRNDHWQDVRIYLVRESGGSPMQLGSVTGLTTDRVSLPPTTPQFVRLLLRPLGSRVSHLTQPVFLEPGRTVQLTVANALAQSSIITR